MSENKLEQKELAQNCIAKRKKDGKRCENKCVENSQFCGVHNRRNKAQSPGFHRCIRLTSKGSLCIGEAEEGKLLCKRHRKLDEMTHRGYMNGSYINPLNTQVHESDDDETKADETKTEEMLRNQILNQLFMAFGIYNSDFSELTISIENDNITSSVNNSSTSNNSSTNNSSNNSTIHSNILTRGERDCSICYEPKTMIIMHCCRQEMCIECMKQITNQKCPFCKQYNAMKVL